MHILFINDHRLQLYSQDLVCETQGYALLDEARVRFDLNAGSAPVSKARSHPNQVDSRFWQYCDESAIASNGAGLRHSADLVWTHLSALKQKYSLESLVLVVPAHYQTQQLQLLVGIAKAAGIEPVAVINKAVLAATKISDSTSKPIVFIDLHLHQTVVSYLEPTATTISSSAHEVISGCSIAKLQDAVLNQLQNRFIEQDRFDPLHHADTEQQLFDQLNAAATAIVERGEAKILANFNTKLYSQSLDEPAWRQASEACFTALFATLSASLSAGPSGNARQLSDCHVVIDSNGAFDQQLILQLAQSYCVDSIMAPKASMLLESVWGALEGESARLASQGKQSQSDPDHFVYLSELAYTRTAPPQSETKSFIDTDAGAGKAQVQSSNVDSKSGSTNATHIALNGLAMPITQAALDFVAGEIRFVQALPNVDVLLTQGKLKLVSGDVAKLPLQLGERLVSELGDGVLVALKVIE